MEELFCNAIPLMERDGTPDGFDYPEWPCSCQPTVNARPQTTTPEKKREPTGAGFEGIENHHQRDNGRAECSEHVHPLNKILDGKGNHKV